ncbi:MAG TPA: glutamate-5-semialdehyde dehydrogenase [Fimbriimonadaceae bacterium]|nr:glutamate-5-semialdehyde dehydrogenase [Fimbriimonadaceae bacterium]
MNPVIETAAKAHAAGRRLAGLSAGERNRLLLTMAASIESHAEEILAANRRDMAAVQGLLDSGELTKAAAKRLELTTEKLAGIVEGVRQVAALPDPLGRIELARELDEGLILRRITHPVGVIGVIFESRPDALPQIVSLCLKSGNAALLKGGKEAEQTNAAMFAAILGAGVPTGAYALLAGREQVAQMLEAEGLIDLIIPRGSNELVRYIMDNTHIPVLGHAAGICHVYVDAEADPEKAFAICIDSKIQYPAACNAAETILVHEAARSLVPELIRRLVAAGVEVRADPSLSDLARPASEADFGCEFSDMIVALKVVASLDDAIEHIGRYGSHHTESIVTENPETAARFMREVDSAGVFHNASTRFADGFRYGFGAEVGISNGKLHPRGPVGLEGLVTYRYHLEGKGHIVATYSGPNARRFTHREASGDGGDGDDGSETGEALGVRRAKLDRGQECPRHGT